MRHAIIMAGGSGTRFWPASRRTRPKQLLPLGGESPLLRRTFERVRPLVPPERIWVVTTAGLAAAVAALLPELPRDRLLLEPTGRDTAPCCGYAAVAARAADPEAVCLVLPADHVIADEAGFRAAAAAGLEWVEREGGLLTFGVRPTRPETGYGYLRLGERAGEVAGHPVHRLERFVEKPDEETARRYLADGGYLWNAGMFAWRAGDLLGEIARQLPELASGLETIAGALGGASERAVLERVYPELPRISVDYGVMEGARRLWTVPVAFGWSDVGSWLAAWEASPRDGEGNACRGRVLAVDCRDSAFFADGPAVVAVGLERVAVIATPDAVLVLPLPASQRVKEVVEELGRRGWDDLL